MRTVQFDAGLGIIPRATHYCLKHTALISRHCGTCWEVDIESNLNCTVVGCRTYVFTWYCRTNGHFLKGF